MQKQIEKRERKEIPNTWIDFIMYPAGVIVGAILAAIVKFCLR